MADQGGVADQGGRGTGATARRGKTLVANQQPRHTAVACPFKVPVSILGRLSFLFQLLNNISLCVIILLVYMRKQMMTIIVFVYLCIR